MKLIEDFNAIPSLGLLTAIQIAVTVWNCNAITRSISKCLSLVDARAIDERWRKISLGVQSAVQYIENIPLESLPDMDAIIFSVGCHIRKSRICKFR
ncbi:hypothetical protein TNIN_105031, partial [Trichonephila inaurata madagascariensis]